MSEFKVGDWVFTNDDVTPYVYEIIYKKGEHYKLRSKNGVRYCREWRIDRHATEGEIKAGYRAESFEFDKYWYGQSEADAIKEHEALQDELIHGGAVFVGDNSNIVQMVKDAVEHGHGFAMVSIEGVEHVSIAHAINPFPCEELGDDFPIENHISPNCQSRDV